MDYNIGEVIYMNFHISEFAEKCGVSKETIRYYERKKLLQEPERSISGYRLYSDIDVKRVEFIKRLQGLSFSLNEIYKLLGVVDKDKDRCVNMYDFISHKEQEINKKIEDLKRIDGILKELKICCPNENQMYNCPIIDRLID
jgi:MerR family transcriptional regulator, mercuric resistance operon regulatory protein